MTRSGDRFDDLLGAYVLGACPPAEAEAIAAHLGECKQCAREAARLGTGAEPLADVTPVASTERVKSSVMAVVRAEAELFDAARRPAREPDRPAARPHRPSFRLRLPSPALAAGIACALMLAVGVGALGAKRLGTDGSSRTVVTAQVSNPQSKANLDIREGHGQLNVHGLRHPGRGRVYQVWVRKGREVPRPAGVTFTVDSRGDARTGLPGNLRGVEQVLVTSEPVGGSPLPTRVPVLQVDTAA